MVGSVAGSVAVACRVLRDKDADIRRVNEEIELARAESREKAD